MVHIDLKFARFTPQNISMRWCMHMCACVNEKWCYRMCVNKNMFSNECVFISQYKLLMRNVQRMRFPRNSHITEI